MCQGNYSASTVNSSHYLMSKTTYFLLATMLLFSLTAAGCSKADVEPVDETETESAVEVDSQNHEAVENEAEDEDEDDEKAEHEDEDEDEKAETNQSSNSEKTETTTDSAAPATPTTPATTNTEDPAAATATYKDGTYSKAGSYSSPAGAESVTVTLTVKGDKIASVSTSTNSANPESQKYLSKFASGISAAVVGKTLDQANVSRINGSSLTGKGFNAALEQIKSAARN